MRLFLLPPHELLELCFHERRWTQVQEVEAFFRSKMPPAVIAFSRLQAAIARLQEEITPATV